MKILQYLLLVFCLAYCRSRVAKKEVPDLNLMPDPLASHVHDSLKHLIPTLDSVLKSDQKYRWGIHLQPKEVQEDMKNRMKENAEEIKTVAEHNVRVVSDILDRYGFLGPRDIGMKGYFAIVGTIQHADKETQKKYLPIFYKAVQQKKLIPLNYAMLVDRVAIRHNAPQVYGTQINVAGKKAEVMPLLNADSVDIWRRQVGMEPLEAYVKRFNGTWNAEEYKKKLTELRLKYKITDTLSTFYKPLH
jgi:hypothetical protein